MKMNHFFIALVIAIILFSGIHNSSYSTSFVINADSTVSIYRLQVAVCSTMNSAVQLKQDLVKKNIPLLMVSILSTRSGFRVLVGPWPNKSEAQTVNDQLWNMGYFNMLIVTTDIPLETARQWKWNLPLVGSLYRQALSDNTSISTGSLSSLYTNAAGVWSSAQTDTTVNLQPAISSLAQVINHSQDTAILANARYTLGQIYINQYRVAKQGQTPRMQYAQAAEDVLTEYINQYPQSPKADLVQKQIADCQHALSLYYTKRLWKTAASYKKVLDSYGSSTIAPEAHLQYAGVLFEIAESKVLSWDSVRAELTKAETLYPAAEKTVKSRASAMKAETYLYENNYQAMIDNAQTTLNTYPDCTADIAIAHYLIGRAHLHLKNYNLAFAQFNYILATFDDTSANDPLVGLMCSAALYGNAWCYNAIQDSTNFHISVNTLLRKYPNTQEGKCVKLEWNIDSPSDIIEIVHIPIPSFTNSLIAGNGRKNHEQE